MSRVSCHSDASSTSRSPESKNQSCERGCVQGVVVAGASLHSAVQRRCQASLLFASGGPVVLFSRMPALRQATSRPPKRCMCCWKTASWAASFRMSHSSASPWPPAVFTPLTCKDLGLSATSLFIQGVSVTDGMRVGLVLAVGSVLVVG